VAAACFGEAERRPGLVAESRRGAADRRERVKENDGDMGRGWEGRGRFIGSRRGFNVVDSLTGQRD
jgi:hypothetical protein